MSIIFLIGGTAGATSASAAGITLTQNRFLKDGEFWAPRGFSLTAWVTPDKELPQLPAFQKAREKWGPQLLEQAKSFNADTLRFQVSEAGLDPESPIYDPNYLSEIMAAIIQVRQAGFVVVISMQWEKPGGLDGEPGMPSVNTQRAWQKLAPIFAHDPYVMLELFNEPAMPPTNSEAWALWQAGMQGIVDELRQEGAENVLVLDGISGSHYLTNAPAIYDPLHKIAYAVHPYFRKDDGPELWTANWGRFAETHPVFVSEWNALPAEPSCTPEMPQIAHELIDYLYARHMGLLIWSLEFGDTVVDKNGQLIGFNGFECGKSGTGAAYISVQYFKALAQLEETGGPVPVPPPPISGGPEPIPVPPPITPPAPIPVPAVPVPFPSGSGSLMPRQLQQ